MDNITSIILKLQEHKARFGKQAQNNTGAGFLDYLSVKQCVLARQFCEAVCSCTPDGVQIRAM